MRRNAGLTKHEPRKESPPGGDVEEILRKIRDARNFDFRNYKRPTLLRRMQDRGKRTLREYGALLDRQPAEFDALLTSMSVKVTSFFRDARKGQYTREQVESVPRKSLAEWFVEEGDAYAVRKELRRNVVFGINNLVSDAPISRLDLLIFRNVFIYLDAALQKRVLSRFHYALRPHGILMLGKSELIPFAGRIYGPVDLTRRIYRKDGRRDNPFSQDRLMGLLEQETVTREVDQPKDQTGTVDQFHRDVRQSLRLPVVATTLDGTVMLVHDVTSLRRMESELRQANQERQSAYEEMQTVNEEMQSSNEELETTNEELQSANEELQTTNEELQSANEELQTTNEELQSTNAELDATNRELAHRTEEMNKLAFNQRVIIRSLSAAVIVRDGSGKIIVWNLAAERLLGLAEGEAIGQVLWALQIRALNRGVLAKVRKALGQNLGMRSEEIAYELANGGAGKATLVAVPILDGGAPLGAVLMFEDTSRMAALQAEIARLKENDARAAQDR